MPLNITKPVVLICGSRSIKTLNLSRFINPDHVGAVVSGGAIGVDSIAKKWAKKNHLEFIEMKPNYKVFKKKAPLIRNQDMVNFSDVVIAFWDGKSQGTDYTIQYAKKAGCQILIHLIIDL